MREIIFTDRQSEIENLIVDLVGNDSATYENAFTSLCKFFLDEDILFIHNRLAKDWDSKRIYWLVRYLVQIERPFGFEKLVQLAWNESEAVREEACSGLNKISRNERVDLMIQLLELPFPKQLAYIVSELGELREPRSVYPLINAFESSKNDDVRIEIAVALRRIRDTRAIKYLEKWLPKVQEEVRREVLVSLGTLAAANYSRFLKEYLFSEDEQVREIAYRTIVRLKGGKWEKMVVSALEKEKEARLRMVLLSSIRTITQKILFDEIFHFALSDASTKVCMLAESLLRRVSSKKLAEWLVEKIKQGRVDEQELALRLITAFSKYANSFEVVHRAFKSTQEARIQICCLEQMGTIQQKESYDFLLGAYQRYPQYRYSTVLSLLMHVKPYQWKTIEAIFDLSQGTDTITVQLVLHYICRLPKHVAISAVMDEKINEALSHQNAHLRLLAARALTRSFSANMHEQLVAMAGTDRSKAVRSAAMKSLREICFNHSEELDSMVKMCLSNQWLLRVARQLFKTMSVESEGMMNVLKAIVEYIQEGEAKSEKLHRFRTRRGLALLRPLVVRHRAYYLEALQSHIWSEPQRKILMQLLNATDIASMSGIDVSFMTRQYGQMTSETKEEYLKFFLKLRSRHQVIESLVFKELESEADVRVSKLARAVVGKWLDQQIASTV